MKQPKDDRTNDEYTNIINQFAFVITRANSIISTTIAKKIIHNIFREAF